MRSMSLLVMLCVVGCGSPLRESETLGESIRAYNEGVRWERFAVAANQLPPSERSAFVAAMDERAEDLKITDYEIVNVDRRSRKEARVQVKVSWYLDTAGSVHETHAVQTWEQHGRMWLMVDETRLRGPEMPGLTNPADPEASASTAPPTAATVAPPTAATVAPPTAATPPPEPLM